MTDSNPNPAEPSEPEAKEPTAETPPWGDDFDAARAWKTIQDQRAAEADLKTKLAAYEKAEQEKADAERTDLERAIARAEQAEAEAKAARRAALLAKSTLPEDVHSFITAEDEEGIADQIAKLSAALSAQSGPAPDEDPEPSTDPSPGRPKPALTPGHGGDDTAPFDPDAIVAAVRGRR